MMGSCRRQPDAHGLAVNSPCQGDMDPLAAMKAHYLTPLFQPKSVVVIGASETINACGRQVFSNLLDSPYAGTLYGVNLRHESVFGVAVYKQLADIPEDSIDLAIITTPARTVVHLMRECAECGVKTALLLSRDFVAVDKKSRSLLDEAIAIAHKHGIRVLGPNLLGLFRPSSGLAAANYEGLVKPGPLALVSQSSSVASAMLDWAEAHHVGFSAVVSLGAAADVNFGEILDYLSQDPETHAILIYLEDVGEARRFMSALRVAGRTKPITVMKVGRYPEEGDRLLARTHSERLIGRDDAFDAALRRAGVLRVETTIQMTIAARMLAADFRVIGRRLAIISNGYSAGQMAVDRAHDLGVQLPKLDPATITHLKTFLPPIGNHDNPIDIRGDAPPERFIAATQACLADPNTDGVLVILTPQVGTDHYATAESMIALRNTSKKMLMLAWMGDKKIAASRQRFDEARMAYFFTPEHAVEAFANLASYGYIQQISLQTPGPLASHIEPDLPRAREVINLALKAGRSVLNVLETLAVLEAFRIPVAPTLTAATPEEAVAAAGRIGLPVALKINADNLLHKTEVGGVQLNLHTLGDVFEAATRMLDSAGRLLPAATLHGLIVQKMHGKAHGRELMAGIRRDEVFGPLVAFGAGGLTVEVFDDLAVSLPPLNDMLAAGLIKRTRIDKALGPFRNLPAVDMAAVRQVLLSVSEMACELPELLELELNPIVADEDGVVAVDATLIIGKLAKGFTRYGHMAIYPYPSHLASSGQFRDGSPCTIRPIRPEDANELQRFVKEDLSDESRFHRFLSSLKELPPVLLARFTQLDYARDMALVITHEENGTEHIAGVARYTLNPDSTSCEFALAIADHRQGQGLGRKLMEALFKAARDAGLESMEGEVLATNSNMLGLIKHLDFEIRTHPEDSQLKWVVRSLTEAK